MCVVRMSCLQVLGFPVTKTSFRTVGFLQLIRLTIDEDKKAFYFILLAKLKSKHEKSQLGFPPWKTSVESSKSLS